MNHLHSIRVAYENWLYDDRFADLLRLLTENRGGTLYTCTYALKHRVELLNLAEEIE